MALPPASPSVRRTVLRLEAVTVALPDGGQLGPIDWALERGRRIRANCAREEHWHAFVALLSGERRPASGVLEEIRKVRVQTDGHQRETLDLNRTLDEYLHSPDAPEHVWLQGRRRSLWVLVDLLGITPAMTRRALKLQGPEVQHKVWALRLLLSRADVVIVRELLRSADPSVQTALQRRWSDLPGALIAAESDRPLPGPVEGWLRFDDQGRFSAGIEPPASAPGAA